MLVVGRSGVLVVGRGRHISDSMEIMWARMGKVPVGRGREFVPVGTGGELVPARKPAVQRLSVEELPRVLPWSGSGPQLLKEVGKLEACTVRVAMSLVACSLIYNISIEVASVAAFYWAWAPIYRTALPNILLRLRYRYAGMWSAQVVKAQIVPPLTINRGNEGVAAFVFDRLPKMPSTLRLVIGDGSTATFELEVPLTDEVPEVQAGEQVGVLVLSDKPSLSRFKALDDVYFPDRRLWISENRCIERLSFERLHKSLYPSSRNQDIEEGTSRKSGNLFLEENTLVGDGISLESVENAQQLSRLRGLDYAMQVVEGKKDRRRVKELNDAELYL